MRLMQVDGGKVGRQVVATVPVLHFEFPVPRTREFARNGLT